MKKKIALLTAALAVMVLCASTIGYTAAYFADRDTAEGSSASAGNLVVELDLDLASYGVPSDTLLNAFGATPSGAPGKSAITVTNKGSADMEYTLILTVTAETAEMLEANGVSLVQTDGDRIALTYDSTNMTYTSGKIEMKSDASLHEYDLELTFKGEDLPLDGNHYQGMPIKITATVDAVQSTN